MARGRVSACYASPPPTPLLLRSALSKLSSFSWRTTASTRSRPAPTPPCARGQHTLRHDRRTQCVAAALRAADYGHHLVHVFASAGKRYLDGSPRQLHARPGEAPGLAVGPARRQRRRRWRDNLSETPDSCVARARLGPWPSRCPNAPTPTSSRRFVTRPQATASREGGSRRINDCGGGCGATGWAAAAEADWGSAAAGEGLSLAAAAEGSG